MQKKEKRSLFFLSKAFAPAFLWAGLIFFLSAQSSLQGFETNTFDFIFKKVAHMFVYFILYLLLLSGTTQSTNSKKHQLAIPLIICLLYAVSDEVHQSFVPGRYATLRDIGYDTLGIGVGFLKSYDYI